MKNIFKTAMYVAVIVLPSFSFAQYYYYTPPKPSYTPPRSAPRTQSSSINSRPAGRITDIRMGDPTGTSVTLYWTTTNETSTHAWYREIKPDGTSDTKAFNQHLVDVSTDTDKNYVTNHTYTITDLKPNTNYMVSVGGRDQYGLPLQSFEYPFTTKDASYVAVNTKSNKKAAKKKMKSSLNTAKNKEL